MARAALHVKAKKKLDRIGGRRQGRKDGKVKDEKPRKELFEIDEV